MSPRITGPAVPMPHAGMSEQLAANILALADANVETVDTPEITYLAVAALAHAQLATSRRLADVCGLLEAIVREIADFPVPR